MAGHWTKAMANGWLVMVLTLWCASVSADVPHLIRYQGQAVDSKGVPLEGPYTLTFRLYDAATGGTKVWEETQANVPLSKGHFSVLLGQVTPLNVDWSTSLWLTIQVGTDPELLPRQRITSVPLAIRSEVAESLTNPITTSMVTGTFTPSVISPQGSGSSLDADTVDGKHASDLLKIGDSAGGDLAGTYPSPTVNFPFTHVQALAASGMWIKPPNVTKVFVRAWGGGGGGGGGAGSDSTTGWGTGGGGGGGGEYREDIVSVSGDVPVTVGAGGAGGGGGANGNHGGAGGNGGDSNLGSLVVAKGGAGGAGGTFKGASGGLGGKGGSGGTGAVSIAGRNGKNGVAGGTWEAAGGNGGQGAQGFTGGLGSTTLAAPGNQADGLGGGGGGGAGAAQGKNNYGSSGGAGSAGYVIIYY